MRPDPVSEAIAVAEQPQPIRMEQREVRIASTGRPFVFALPSDVTEAELFEVIGWMATAFRQHVQQQGRPASRLVVPSGVVIRQA